MKAPPYLPLGQRVAYLDEKGYFPEVSPTDAELERLESVNFHYLLGYARNLKAASSRAKLPAPVLSDLFQVMDLDHEISTVLYAGIRRMEWRLRAATVASYCNRHSSTGTFVDPECFVALNDAEGAEDLVSSVIDNILRYREPYVRQHLESRAKELDIPCPTGIRGVGLEQSRALIGELPIWAVVDSFSLELLSKFIECCDVGMGDSDAVFKQVAESFDVSAQVVVTDLKCMVFLRNTVSHQARLWMRPTANSPREPRLYKRRARQAHSKSMYWALLTLAKYLGDEAEPFLDDVDRICEGSALYKYGIQWPVKD